VRREERGGGTMGELDLSLTKGNIFVGGKHVVRRISAMKNGGHDELYISNWLLSGKERGGGEKER